MNAASKLLSYMAARGNTQVGGDIRAVLGEDAFATAIERRWLVLSEDYNGLSFNLTPIVMQEIHLLAEEDSYAVGDQVLVTDEGQTYVAAVQGKNADGSLILSFGENKPKHERSYQTSEIKKVAEPTVDRDGKVQQKQVQTGAVTTPTYGRQAASSTVGGGSNSLYH